MNSPWCEMTCRYKAYFDDSYQGLSLSHFDSPRACLSVRRILPDMTRTIPLPDMTRTLPISGTG
jgi:hypothetical protein